MTGEEILTGNAAVAHGVRLAQPGVIPLVPISPQTGIAEHLSEFVARDELDAELVNIDGEHSAMSASYGAQVAGVRSFTATCSHGLAFMHEPIAQATAYRLPIVMAVTNRRLGSLHSSKPDYTDSMPERDVGWMQFYVESNQEALDTIIQAYKIAEDDRVHLPAMVNLDGFYLSYSNEPVAIPTRNAVEEFLPPYEARKILADPNERFESPLLTAPSEVIGTYERLYQDAMERAKEVIEEVDGSYGEHFGREYGGLLDVYRAEDADVLLVTMGSMTTAARRAVDALRNEGTAAGLLKIRAFRPFPAERLREIADGVEAIAVIDRSVSRGGEGGPLFTDIRSALFPVEPAPNVRNFIAGLAGTDITPQEISSMARSVLEDVDNATPGPAVEFIEDRDAAEQYSPPPTPTIERPNEVFGSGMKSCAGCGMMLVLRHALDITGEKTALSIPSSCALAVTRSEPFTTPLGVPIVPTNMPSPGGVLTGMQRAMRVKGREETTIMGFAGDGSTSDIGFSSLSGAAERGESVLWLTYDNEAYMNTGIQSNSSTPQGALTTTTPEGSAFATGEDSTSKKNVPLLMALHDGVEYVGTASVAYVDDLRQKIETALEVTKNGDGMAYLHVQTPCPPGWQFPEDETISVARAAVRSRAWPLFEVVNGELTMSRSPDPVPIAEYLEMQGRFDHLDEDQYEDIQESVDANWDRLRRIEEHSLALLR